MKRCPKILVGLSLLLVFGIASAADQRADIGTVVRVQKNATATYKLDTRPLAQQTSVWFEDLLQTGPGARLAVTLADDTELTLGENGSLLVDSFVYSPENDKGELALQVIQGAFLFVGGGIEKTSAAEVSIQTQVGTLGIRGTTVWGGPIDNGFGVLTLAGEVVVSNSAGSVTLNPGEGTMIQGPDQAPQAVKVWPQEKVDRAVATISFADQ